MKRALPWILGAVVIAAFLLTSSYLQEASAPPSSPSEGGESPERIVSLAPSLTEILFAIGAGPRVVGVSSYTTYPPEATELPALGGHHDPNLEALVALSPDRIVTLGRLDKVAEHAERLSIPLTEVPTDTLPEIFEAITVLGALTGQESEAAALRGEIEEGLERMRARHAGDAHTPCVLIVVGREPGAIEGVYSVAGDAFINPLLEAAGGRNCVEHEKDWPQLSTEAIVAAQPEVILELAPGIEDAAAERERSLQIWRDAGLALPAVERGALVVLSDDHLLLPGPRILKSARVIEAALASVGEPP